MQFRYFDSVKETTSILLGSKNSREALRRLYHFAKSKRANLSLSLVLEKTGIPSRGYLSMVLNGKKTLGMKYLAKMVRIFGLSASEARYLETLVQLDLSKSAKTEHGLQQELGKVRAELEIRPQEVKSHFASYLLLSEIFCTLSLFKEPPTLNQVHSRMLSRSLLEVQSALSELVSLKILEQRASDGRYHQLQEQVAWIDGGNSEAVIQGIREIYEDGIKNLPRFFSRRDLAFYNASIISTNWERYHELLLKLRDEVYQMERTLDSNEADSLVRLNVQIYPVAMPAESSKSSAPVLKAKV